MRTDLAIQTKRQVYEFFPQEDITAIELAEIMSLGLLLTTRGGYGSYAADSLEKMSAGARRHFHVVAIEEEPAPSHRWWEFWKG